MAPFIQTPRNDIGFVVLDNGDFRVGRNHGSNCRAGCGWTRLSGDLVATRTAPTIGVWVQDGGGNLVPRRT